MKPVLEQKWAIREFRYLDILAVDSNEPVGIEFSEQNKALSQHIVDLHNKSLEVCEWGLMPEDPNGSVWGTQCGNGYFFNEGGPTENDQKFCGFCGKPIK